MITGHNQSLAELEQLSKSRRHTLSLCVRGPWATVVSLGIYIETLQLASTLSTRPQTGEETKMDTHMDTARPRAGPHHRKPSPLVLGTL